MSKTKISEKFFSDFLLVCLYIYSYDLRNNDYLLLFLCCKLFKYGNSILNQPSLFALYGLNIIDIILSIYIIIIFQLDWLFIISIILMQCVSLTYSYDLYQLIRLNNLN